MDGAWTAARLSRVCALGDADFLTVLTEAALSAAGPVIPLQEPTTELVMMETGDPVGGGTFYVGEVLVTTALLEVDGAIGCGVVLGHDKERARAAAALDALFHRDDMSASAYRGLALALADEERRIDDQHRREWALSDRTRVHFETMEDRDPGVDRPVL